MKFMTVTFCVTISWRAIYRGDSGTQRLCTLCSNHAIKVADLAPRLKLASPGTFPAESTFSKCFRPEVPYISAFF